MKKLQASPDAGIERQQEKLSAPTIQKQYSPLGSTKLDSARILIEVWKSSMTWATVWGGITALMLLWWLLKRRGKGGG
jgi:hypothetical protein